MSPRRRARRMPSGVEGSDPPTPASASPRSAEVRSRAASACDRSLPVRRGPGGPHETPDQRAPCLGTRRCDGNLVTGAKARATSVAHRRHARAPSPSAGRLRSARPSQGRRRAGVAAAPRTGSPAARAASRLDQTDRAGPTGRADRRTRMTLRPAHPATCVRRRDPQALLFRRARIRFRRVEQPTPRSRPASEGRPEASEGAD